jgi:hypothetical protein
MYPGIIITREMSAEQKPWNQKLGKWRKNGGKNGIWNSVDPISKIDQIHPQRY